MGISKYLHVAGVCARRAALAAGGAVMLCASSGCPEPGTRAMATTTPTTPTTDLSVFFHLEPLGRQIVLAPQTLTYRVVVDSKGVLNAGVEFEAADVSLITATLNPARIAETARETQLVVQVPAGTRPADYDFTLRARLTVAGQGAPAWSPAPVLFRVASGESLFSVTCTGELVMRAGQTETLTCRTIREQGFTGIITLSFVNRPGYITIVPETVNVGPDVGGFAFTVNRIAAPTITPAFIDLVVTGQSGNLTRQSTVRIQLPAT